MNKEGTNILSRNLKNEVFLEWNSIRKGLKSKHNKRS